MREYNKDIVKEMLSKMPEKKKEVLGKALDRNMLLTSTRAMSWVYLTVYREGWLLELEGTRCEFSVYAKDNDGEFVFTRKPNESNIHMIYHENARTSELDMDEQYFDQF